MSTVAASGTVEGAVDAAAISTSTPNTLADKKKKQRPWSKNRLDEKRIDSNESDDDETNTTATKTGDVSPPGGKDANANDKDVLPPVSIPELYRFSTKFEIFTGAIGLVAAVCAGAAQVSRTCTSIQRLISAFGFGSHS